MSRLTRDGTAEPVSRDRILRHARGQGNVHFPCSADHEQDWQPYPVDPYSAICDDHTYIHTYCTATLRSFPDRCFECTHLFFFPSRSRQHKDAPQRSLYHYVFLLRYSITSMYTIYNIELALVKTLRPTQVLAESFKVLRTGSLLAFFSLFKE